jgi:hypothetical protein
MNCAEDREYAEKTLQLCAASTRPDRSAIQKINKSNAEFGCNHLRLFSLRRLAFTRLLTGENGIFVPIII